MKVFWCSAAVFCTTGYGIMSREILKRLVNLLPEYEFINVADTGPHGYPWGMNLKVSFGDKKIRILPSTQQGSGGVVEYYVKKYKPDLIVVFWDPFPTLNYLLKLKVPYMFYVPIDGIVTERTVHPMKKAIRIVAYSKFGYKELKRYFDLNRLFYIPHGIDTKMYKRVESNKREELGIPEDSVVFVNISANIGPRKCLPQLLLTFANLVKKVKDCYLILVTNSADWPRGYNLQFYIEQLKLKDNVILIDRETALDPISEKEKIEILSCSDYYISSSESEGFGIPLLEAMSCSTPVIAPRNSSQEELSQIQYDTSIDYVSAPIYVPYCTFYKPPSLIGMLNAMNFAYEIKKNDENLYKNLQKSARRRAEEYDWNKVIKRWIELFRDIEFEVELLNSLKSEKVKV